MIPKRSFILTGSLVFILVAGIVTPVVLRALRTVQRASESRAPAGQCLVTIEVGGMECAACVAKISSSLSAVPGVSSVDVSLQKQQARVVCAPAVAETALTAAVRRAGPDYIGLILRK